MPQQLVNALGWTIIHSVWQGFLIALLLAAVLYLLKTRAVNIRYLAAVGALLIFVSLSVRTFVEHYKTPAVIQMQTEKPSEELEKLLPQELQNITTTNKNDEPAAIRHMEYWFAKYFNAHLPLVVSIYLLGIIILSLKLTGSFLYVQRVKHYRTKTASPKYSEMINELCARLRMTKTIKLLESAIVKTPLTIGYFKPVILFPAGMLTGISCDQLEAILVHELAHIKRADYLVNLFQSVVEIVFFFNPAVWWISSIIKDERENVCDDLAVTLCGKPIILAKGLIYVGQFYNGEKSLAMNSINNTNKLRGRIMRIMGKNKSVNVKNRIYAVSLLLLAFVSFGFFACSSAADSSLLNSSNLIYEEKDNGSAAYSNVDKMDENERRYVFYKYSNGKKTKWDVTIKNNEIVELYKNDELVPPKDYPLCDNMIKHEIADIDDDLFDIRNDFDDLEEEFADLQSEEKEEHIENIENGIQDLREKVNKNFDKNEFKREMKELKEEMNNLKDYDWSFNFDSKEFKEGMEELRKELEDMRININFDSDDFAESMEGLAEQLSNIKVDIPEINIDLSGLDSLSEKLGDLDINMDRLKEHMKKFKSFMREFKSELVADGLIDKYDDIDNLEFEDGDVYLNYEKVPDHLAKKYIELYKEHFGKYPDGNAFSINY